jgi:hypothetical protein
MPSSLPSFQASAFAAPSGISSSASDSSAFGNFSTSVTTSSFGAPLASFAATLLLCFRP